MRILTTLLTAAVAALAGLSSSGPGAVDASNSCTPHPAAWDWPLGALPKPALLRPFQPPRHRWDAGHRGVDLGGYVGEPVLAANSGAVLYAGFLVDRPVVVVGHGLLRTTYEPVAPDPGLRVGVQVRRGQRIGRLVSGHCLRVACLHWGLVEGRGHSDVYYDPLLLLGCGAVRLELYSAGPSSVGSGGAGEPVGAASRTG